MTVRLSIKTQDAEVKAALGRAARAADDLTELMDRIGGALVASTQGRFEDQRSPIGIPWKRSRRAAAIGGQTLKDGGDLQRTMTHRAARDRVEVGSIQPYAGVHQFGATIVAKTPKGLRFKIGNQWIRKRQVTIPARPFLGLDAADREEIPAITAHWLRERIGT